MSSSVLVQRFLIVVSVDAGGVSGFDERIRIGFQNVAYDFRSLEGIHYRVKNAFILALVCALSADLGDAVPDVLQNGFDHFVWFSGDNDDGLMGIALMHLVDHEVGHELEDDGISRPFPAVQQSRSRDQDAVETERHIPHGTAILVGEVDRKEIHSSAGSAVRQGKTDAHPIDQTAEDRNQHHLFQCDDLRNKGRKQRCQRCLQKREYGKQFSDMTVNENGQDRVDQEVRNFKRQANRKEVSQYVGEEPGQSGNAAWIDSSGNRKRCQGDRLQHCREGHPESHDQNLNTVVFFHRLLIKELVDIEQMFPAVQAAKHVDLDKGIIKIESAFDPFRIFFQFLQKLRIFQIFADELFLIGAVVAAVGKPVVEGIGIVARRMMDQFFGLIGIGNPVQGRYVAEFHIEGFHGPSVGDTFRTDERYILIGNERSLADQRFLLPAALTRLGGIVFHKDAVFHRIRMIPEKRIPVRILFIIILICDLLVHIIYRKDQ